MRVCCELELSIPEGKRKRPPAGLPALPLAHAEGGQKQPLPAPWLTQ